MKLMANIKTDGEEDIETAFSEFLDEGLLKIFNTQSNGLLYRGIRTDRILEEAHKISEWVEEELLDDTAFHEIYEELKCCLGSYFSASIGIMMMYGILTSKENVKFRNMKLLQKIESKYKLRPWMKDVTILAYQVRYERIRYNKELTEKHKKHHTKMKDEDIYDDLRGLFEGGNFPNAQINIVPGDGIQISYESPQKKAKSNEEGGHDASKKVATKEMMSRAAKVTLDGGYWKSQRSWSVIFVVYGIWGYQGRVCDFLDEVPEWPDNVAKKMICNRDAVEKLKNKYNFSKNIEEWRNNGVPEQYCILGEQLDAELVKMLSESTDEE